MLNIRGQHCEKCAFRWTLVSLWMYQALDLSGSGSSDARARYIYSIHFYSHLEYSRENLL
jgi:hypothetical protein